MNHRNKTLAGIIVGLLIAFTLNSCDNSIKPVGGKTTYSIYGVLGLKADANYIRVKNLKVPLVNNSRNSLNATVHFKNLRTGRSQLLAQDSLIYFQGVAIHLFKITEPIQPLTTYKVIVKSNAGGHKTTAQVTTPALTTMKITPRSALCGTVRNVTYKKIVTGETLISYVVGKHGNIIIGEKYYVQKYFQHFTGPGGFGSKSFTFTRKMSITCHIKTPRVLMYSAIFGPGYTQNKFLAPDSVKNINRFLGSKLLAVVIDTASFMAYQY